MQQALDVLRKQKPNLCGKDLGVRGGCSVKIKTKIKNAFLKIK